MASYSFNVEKWRYYVLETLPVGLPVVHPQGISRVD